MPSSYSLRYGIVITLLSMVAPVKAVADPEGLGPPDSYDPASGAPRPPRVTLPAPQGTPVTPAVAPGPTGPASGAPAGTGPGPTVIIVPPSPTLITAGQPAAPPTNPPTLIAPRCTEGVPCASEAAAASPAPAPAAPPDAASDSGPAVAAAPAAPAAPAESSGDSSLCGAEHFYKGELGTFSGQELEGSANSLMIGLGYYNVGGLLGGSHYLALTPRLDLHFEVAEDKQLLLSLAVPINVTLWDKYLKGNIPSDQRIRKEDYDELPYDLLKVIKRVRLGRKEDRLYLNLGPLYGASVGHGQVLRRYTPNLDPNNIRIGMQLDGYMDYGGVESLVADLGFKSRVVGLLGFVKPLALFSDHYFMKGFSIGVHYTMDQNAPVSLNTNQYGVYEVDEAGNLAVTSTQVGFLGVDLELKPVRLCNLLDVKLYGDYTTSLAGGKGRGLTGGLLLRSNVGFKPLLNALRGRLEYRSYDNNYVPNYFDSLYEVQKYQFIRGKARGNEPTKYAATLALPRSGSFERGSIYGELSYALVDYLSLGAGIEKVTAGDADNILILHLEVPAMDFLRFFLTYQKFHFTDFNDLFAFFRQGNTSDDEVFYAQARLKILPFMYLNALIAQTYQWDPRVGAGIGGFKAKLDYRVDTEVGFEF